MNTLFYENELELFDKEIDIMCMKFESEMNYLESCDEYFYEAEEGIFTKAIKRIKEFIDKMLKFFNDGKGKQDLKLLEDIKKEDPNAKIEYKFDVTAADKVSKDINEDFKRLVRKKDLTEDDIDKVSIKIKRMRRILSSNVTKAVITVGSAFAVFIGGLKIMQLKAESDLRYMESDAFKKQFAESLKQHDAENAKALAEYERSIAKNKNTSSKPDSQNKSNEHNISNRKMSMKNGKIGYKTSYHSGLISLMNEYLVSLSKLETGIISGVRKGYDLKNIQSDASKVSHNLRDAIGSKDEKEQYDLINKAGNAYHKAITPAPRSSYKGSKK